uniref:Uncharacterized protein AlNc14C214G8985 n=1 Tax=Albugo laibachii Nc14 TaxID=890382 RepID=F0WRI4_9STRA|nr:conserved hypothetical protein [Albugo laibachii Nc14]|eukprot:CCA23947.1 conserved hypothetical protein [Albugo laibachii Nc14]
MSQCDGTTLTSALCPHETSDSRTLDDLQQLKSQLIKTLTEFEFQRVEHFQPLLTHNRTYWDRFQAEMTSGTQQIQHLEDFLTRRLEADQAYVEAIRASSSSQLVSPQTLLSSFSDAFESLTRSQEQFAEKLDQFLASIRKDVVHRYLTDLSTQYKHSVEDITQRGSRFQEELTNTHTFVCDSFNSLSTILNDAVDAWRMEFAYFDSVQKWKQTRCEYVKGMAECFQQFKTMEINRITVLQKVMETYLRKQRLFYEQVAHAISEPMTAAERVHPEKDLLQSIRRIPKNASHPSIILGLCVTLNSR